jgi:thiamine biosynthesis lipoprotein
VDPIRIGDRDYYHIVDPRTGQPVDTHVLSVSILFPEAGRNGLADGLSTAGAVLGPDATLKLVTSLGGQALVLVRGPDGGIAVHQTAGFDSWVAR